MENFWENPENALFKLNNIINFKQVLLQILSDSCKILSSTLFWYLADCPAGTKFDGVSKCIECPLHSYQDQQGKLQCTACPKNYITEYVKSVSKSQCKSKCKVLSSSFRGVFRVKSNIYDGALHGNS